MGDSCKGLVAVVTGGSRGIGAGIAKRLAAEGARVVVTARTMDPGDHPYSGSLRETVEEIERIGGEAIPIAVDLSDPDFDRGEIVTRAEATFGPVDILVNDAAASMYIPFTEISKHRFSISMEINVHAPWELMQRVVPSMRERGRGWILNISSGTARIPPGPPFVKTWIGGACIYGGTKAMLERVTVGVALELFDDGIAVNALSPQGGVLTPGASAVTFEKHFADMGHVEPVETMVEAALALCNADPRQLTGRIASSLSLIKELSRPVYTLDGRELLAGWQPEEIAAHLALSSTAEPTSGQRSLGSEL
jgi:NAD(P)-dependent dehydrogenase (short-subunit alcohol dehydrogenase family)